jgi:hypothetical protein
VTNRIFSVTLQFGGQTPSLFSGPMIVRPLLTSVVTSKPAIGGRVKTGQWEAVRD